MERVYEIRSYPNRQFPQGPKCRAPRLRAMTPVELAWVAGLIEGEGSFIVTGRSGRPNGCRARVQMQSTDHDVLVRLRETIGTGVINPVGPRAGHGAAGARKPCWGYALNAMRDVIALMRQLYPHMGLRRRAQIDTALAAFPADIMAVAG
jgi:hypothetical protein